MSVGPAAGVGATRPRTVQSNYGNSGKRGKGVCAKYRRKEEDPYAFWAETRVMRTATCWGDGVSCWLKPGSPGVLELPGDLDNQVRAEATQILVGVCETTIYTVPIFLEHRIYLGDLGGNTFIWKQMQLCSLGVECRFRMRFQINVVPVVLADPSLTSRENLLPCTSWAPQ